jgi:sulfate adenylyltransferase (ADP) / ATP adenylyltransferase
LHSIETEQEIIEDRGMWFVVRRVSSLARRDLDRRRSKTAATAPVDPFLPYDPDLFVADISDTHVGLLNKFNVVTHHLLIVTRRFEPQEALLDRKDFGALCSCLAQIDGLGFYNGGRIGGASQPHKHLQLIPLPQGMGDLPTPVDGQLQNWPGRSPSVRASDCTAGPERIQ